MNSKTLQLAPSGVAPSCNYDATKRSWWTVAQQAQGQVALTPMMSLFQAPLSVAMLTVSYNTMTSGGTPVKSTLTSVLSSKSLSARLMKSIETYPGAVAIAYEVATSNVIAASWPNPNLADDSTYTNQHINPHLNLPTLANISGSPIITNAISWFGGAKNMKLPNADYSIYRDGFAVFMKSMNTPAVPNMNVNILVAVPVSPYDAALAVSTFLTATFMTNALQLQQLSRSVRPVADQNTAITLRSMHSALLENRDIDEIWIADTSLPNSQYTIVDVDNTARIQNPSKPTYVYIRNATVPCFSFYQIKDPVSLKLMKTPGKQPSCNYDATKRTWWAVAKNATGPPPQVAITPMISLFQAPIATLMHTIMFKVTGSSGVPVTSTLTSVMSSFALSSRLMKSVGKFKDAVAVAFEVNTGHVIAASFNNSLSDPSFFSQSTVNPTIVLPTVYNIRGSQTLTDAIAALGGAGALLLPKLQRSQALYGGYSSYVQSVNTPAIPNMNIRVLTAFRVTATSIASSVRTRMISVFSRVAVQMEQLRDSWKPLANTGTAQATRNLWSALASNSLVGEYWATDDSENPGSTADNKYTMVDVDRIGAAPFKATLMVKNSSLSCLTWYSLDATNYNKAIATSPTGRTDCAYNPNKRFWMDYAVNASGRIAATPVMSLSQSPVAVLMLTMTYSGWTNTIQNGGQPVKGSLTSVLTTKTLSKVLQDVVKPFAKTDAIVYEVATKNVIATSWNSSISGNAHFNQNHINPHLDMSNLDNISGSAQISAAIKFLGGSAALVKKTLPAVGATKQGVTFAVLSMNSPSVPNMALRVLVAIPSDAAFPPLPPQIVTTPVPPPPPPFTQATQGPGPVATNVTLVVTNNNAAEAKSSVSVAVGASIGGAVGVIVILIGIYYCLVARKDEQKYRNDDELSMEMMGGTNLDAGPDGTGVPSGNLQIPFFNHDTGSARADQQIVM